MIEAYVLINCEKGKAASACNKIKNEKGVKHVKLVTGLHDIVAFVEAEDLTQLAKSILDKIQTTDGVARTITMVAVEV